MPEQLLSLPPAKQLLGVLGDGTPEEKRKGEHALYSPRALAGFCLRLNDAWGSAGSSAVPSEAVHDRRMRARRRSMSIFRASRAASTSAPHTKPRASRIRSPPDEIGEIHVELASRVVTSLLFALYGRALHGPGTTRVLDARAQPQRDNRVRESRESL